MTITIVKSCFDCPHHHQFEISGVVDSKCQHSRSVNVKPDNKTIPINCPLRGERG